jgi:uncharacterized protein
MAYNLPTTTLGRTGLTVTRLGVGGAYCDNAEGYVRALDCGVTYVDTARAYRDGQDEAVIGQAIAGRRHQLVLASKSQSRDAADARRDLETSLTLLGTDYLDLWQIHYLNTAEERAQVLAPGGAYETALKAREEGLIRHIGVTGHVWPEIANAVATGLFDTVLCWYNCAYREPEGNVFPQAQAHNTGVVIMNATRNDKLFSEGGPDPVSFYRYVLSYPTVNVTIIGLRNVELFERMARGLAERASILAEEKAALEAYGAEQRAAGKLEMG